MVLATRSLQNKTTCMAQRGQASSKQIPQNKIQRQSLPTPMEYFTKAERLNGRAAMVGYPAAVATEILTNESLVTQLQDSHIGVPLAIATAGIVTAGSLVKSEDQANFYGRFTPDNEIINGRFAMFGLGALLFTEIVNGTTLF